MVLTLNLIELDKFKDGDKVVLEKVLDAIKQRLYARAKLIVNDPFDAEDIVADAILELWNYRANIQSARHIVNYVYQVVRHKTLDFIDEYPLRLTPLYYQLPQLVTDPQLAMLEDELLEQFIYWAGRAQSILDKMPQKYAEVLKLHLEGKNNKDIADQLHITPNTVKNHLSRAKNNLAQLLLDEGFPRDILLLILACFLS